MLRSRILGCGSYLPEKVLTNDDLAKTVDTNNDWIVGRTGISQRHIAADGQLTSDLALAAAERAIAAAGIDVSELDLLILATSTPDNTFPATAAKVQARLGMHQGAAFDVQAVCAGFICALGLKHFSTLGLGHFFGAGPCAFFLQFRFRCLPLTWSRRAQLMD